MSEFRRYLPWMHAGTVVGFHDTVVHAEKIGLGAIEDERLVRLLRFPTPRGVASVNRSSGVMSTPAKGGYRRSIRVLQVVTSTQRRGAEVFAVDLGDALAGHDQAVRTVALSASTAEGALALPVLGSGALHPSTLRALRREARGTDVVIAHGSRTLPACALALIGTRVPFVYRNIGDPTYWSGQGLRHWRTRAFLARAAGVVALTQQAADTLRTGYGIPAAKLTVIPTGVRSEHHQPATPEQRRIARTALDLAPEARVALVIGALSEEKCVDVAIDAVAQLPGVELLVAGDGPQRAQLEAHAREHAPERVHFLGSLTDPSSAYDAADVVVLTSRSEGLPAVLIEAGMRAIPAVATDVGYVRDVVIDGETGHVVPVGDAAALADGIDHATTNSGLAASARRRFVERYTLERIADDWWRTLMNIAEDGAR